MASRASDDDQPEPAKLSEEALKMLDATHANDQVNVRLPRGSDNRVPNKNFRLFLVLLTVMRKSAEKAKAAMMPVREMPLSSAREPPSRKQMRFQHLFARFVLHFQ